MSLPFSHNPYAFSAVEQQPVQATYYAPPMVSQPINYHVPQEVSMYPAVQQPQQYPVQQQYVSDAAHYNQAQEELSLQYYEQQSTNSSFSQYSTPVSPNYPCGSSYQRSPVSEEYGEQVTTVMAHQPYINLPPAAACAGYDMQTAKHATMAPSPIAIPAPRSSNKSLAPQVNVVPRIRRTASIRSSGSNGTDEISSHSSEPATGRTTPNAAVSVNEEGPYHKPLLGRCEFRVPPPAQKFDPKTQPQYSVTPHSVFLGQVRLEIKPAALRATIEFLTGVRPSKIESRGTGCFLVYLNKKEDIEVVRSLNRRVLFDKGGLWHARTEEEAAALSSYIAEVVSKSPKGFRLPKDALVVAEEKTNSTPSTPKQL